MGYYTDCNGAWDIRPQLQPHHRAYLEAFLAKYQHAYKEEELAKLPDPLREAVGLPVGTEGLFSLAMESPDAHWTSDGITLDPPKMGDRPGLKIIPTKKTEGAPGFYCHWEIESDEEGDRIVGPDSAKFYDYEEWAYFIWSKLLRPWGYTLYGQIDWLGEDRTDMGQMVFRDGKLEIYNGLIHYDRVRTWGEDASN